MNSWDQVIVALGAAVGMATIAIAKMMWQIEHLQSQVNRLEYKVLKHSQRLRIHFHEDDYTDYDMD